MQIVRLVEQLMCFSFFMLYTTVFVLGKVLIKYYLKSPLKYPTFIYIYIYIFMKHLLFLK